MSPVASNGTPHSRSTSVHLGGPVSTGNGTKLNGIDTMAGASRIWPHLDDLKRARPSIDINSPLRTIIHEAELCAKLSETQIDFRRPDLALQEHIKATTLVAETLPRHKDYPALQTDSGELHRAYVGLQKRIQAQSPKIDEAIEIIKESNKSSGVQPTGRLVSNSDRPQAQPNGHVRAQSVQSPNRGSGYPPNGYQNAGHSIDVQEAPAHTPLSVSGSPARRKPPVHPKPDALRGKALNPTISIPSPRSPKTDLEARFARLRSPAAGGVQDSRIQTRPISVSESPQASGQSPVATRNSAIRLTGPREMPSAPTSIVRPTKISVDVQMPGMPRPPDAIYSPERNTDSLTGLDLPSSVPRASPYIGSKGQTSAPPISTVGPSPSVNLRTDYFSFDSTPTSGNPKDLSARQEFTLPDTTTITAEQLEKYFRLASQGLRMLLVDLRNREEFDGGHILAQSIICVEPFVLRDGMSAEELGDSNVISPDSEQKLYEQRHEFDLVVFYDQSSSSFKSGQYLESSYLQNFAKAVFDYGYSKQLKQRPMLLLGGLDAWVDLMGPGSLKASSSSTASARKGLKPARPLGRVPMARDTSRLQALARRPRESRPLSKEEENKWAETLREEPDISVADGENGGFEEFSYARTTEDFLRKYPELPSVQESMISAPRYPAVASQPKEVVSSVPRPPTRPAPALPRQRSSGISERGPSAGYALNAGTGPSTITSTPIPQGLTGLDTTGVTCYVNAVLQGLSATKGFRDFLIHFHYSTDKLPPRKGAEASDPPQLLTRNLNKVFMSLWCGQYEYITPKTLWGYVNALHAKTQPPSSDRNNAFGGSARQHDAQEFLIFILDLMTDELNFKRNSTPYAQITNTDEQLDMRNKLNPIDASYREWQLFEATDDSLVSQLFGGLDMTSNTCQNCQYVSKRWTPFQNLNVNFPPECHGYGSSSSIGLDQLFAHKYSQTELVHGVDCQNCKRKADFVRSDRLSAVPDYLVVNLVRFENRGADLEKVRTLVKFQEKDIDITRFWFGQPDMKSSDRGNRRLKPPFRYDCYAAVAHRGKTIQSGHYLTYARSPDKSPSGAGSWHTFSDKMVVKTTWEEVQNQELTILFLKRNGV